MTKSKKASRVVYHLVHRNSDGQWHLSVVGGDNDVAAFETKMRLARRVSGWVGSMSTEASWHSSLCIARTGRSKPSSPTATIRAARQADVAHDVGGAGY
jgi:hypothetical protein